MSVDGEEKVKGEDVVDPKRESLSVLEFPGSY